MSKIIEENSLSQSYLLGLSYFYCLFLRFFFFLAKLYIPQNINMSIPFSLFWKKIRFSVLTIHIHETIKNDLEAMSNVIIMSH